MRLVKSPIVGVFVVNRFGRERDYLVLSCFGAGLFCRWAVYLLDFYHTYVVASRTIFFSSLHGLFEEAKTVCICICVDQIGCMYLFKDLNEMLSLEPIRLMAENSFSKRDKPKFSDDVYLYVYDKCSKSDPSLWFWRCELKNECKGRVHTKNKQVVKEVNEHCHCASAVGIEVACIKTSLKRKAEETLEAPPTTIYGYIENCYQASQGSLPNSHALKTSYEENAI